jgi:hypothetical protein
MSNKYEQLVEFIINDETDKARELFHQIVVEKSRDIYENLVSEEDLDEVGGNEVEGLVDEVSLDEEGISEEEEGADEFGGEEEVGGEEEFGGEEGGEEPVEARVDDLEAALDELKAEFDALMAGEEHEEHEMPGIHGGDEGHEEMGGEEELGNEEFYEAKEEDEEDEDDEEEDLDEGIVREYVEKVADTNQKNPSGHMAGTGAKSEKQGDRNTKSVVASKNDMGGTAAFAKGGNQDQDGTRPAAAPKTKGELVSNPQNKPGANAGKTAFKTKEASTGAEGKLAGADGSRPINKASVIKTTPR